MNEVNILLVEDNEGDIILTTEAFKDMKLENKISVYPTAASSNVMVSINSVATATYSISLSDILGKQVLSVTKAVEPGSNQSDIDVSNLSKLGMNSVWSLPQG